MSFRWEGSELDNLRLMGRFFPARESADEKAWRLLVRNLSPKQKEELGCTGRFSVRTWFGRFHIDPRSGDIRRRNGTTQCQQGRFTWCMPGADRALAVKLILENAPTTFFGPDYMLERAMKLALSVAALALSTTLLGLACAGVAKFYDDALLSPTIGLARISSVSPGNCNVGRLRLGVTIQKQTHFECYGARADDYAPGDWVTAQYTVTRLTKRVKVEYIIKQGDRSK